MAEDEPGTLVDVVAAENATLRQLVLEQVDYHRYMADIDVCDAGNPDGGSTDACEHCHHVRTAERLMQRVTALDRARAQARKRQVDRLQEVAREARDGG